MARNDSPGQETRSSTNSRRRRGRRTPASSLLSSSSTRSIAVTATDADILPAAEDMGLLLLPSHQSKPSPGTNATPVDATAASFAAVARGIASMGVSAATNTAITLSMCTTKSTTISATSPPTRHPKAPTSFQNYFELEDSKDPHISSVTKRKKPKKKRTKRKKKSNMDDENPQPSATAPPHDSSPLESRSSSDLPPTLSAGLTVTNPTTHAPDSTTVAYTPIHSPLPLRPVPGSPIRTLVNGFYIENSAGTGQKEPLDSGFKTWILTQLRPQTPHTRRWNNRLLKYWELSTDPARFSRMAGFEDNDNDNENDYDDDGEDDDDDGTFPASPIPCPPQRPYTAPPHNCDHL